MLGFMATDDDVGYYSAAVKIKTILVSIVTSLGTFLLPRASYYVEHNLMDDFRKVTKKALNFVFLLAVPLTVYFIIFAKQRVYFLSGSAYTRAIIPMQVIMPTLILIGITNILGIQILVPTGREKYVLYSEIAGAIVDLILNAILIPIYQSTGAAIGTLLAEFAVLVVQYAVLRKEVNSAFTSIKYYKIVIALIIAVCASIWILWLELGSFLTLLVSAILFFVVYGAALILMKEKFVSELFLQFINKIKKI